MKTREKIPLTELQNEDIAGLIVRPLRQNFNRMNSGETPHRHNFQEIIWVKSGAGVHSIDDEIIQIQPNTFYFIGKGQVHYFLEGFDLDGVLIRFTDSFLPSEDYRTSTAHNASFISRMIKTNVIQVATSEAQLLELYIGQLLKEFKEQQQSFGKVIILQHLISIILVQLERISRTQSLEELELIEDVRTQIYREFLLILENHFHTEHTVPFYSRQMGVSRRKLSEIVKIFSGRTAKNIIIDRIITEAKRLLAFTNCSLKEITYKLGYEDPAYFCRLFKLQTGSTPQQYKTQNQL